MSLYIALYHYINHHDIAWNSFACVYHPLPIKADLLVPSDALLVASTRHGTRVAVVVINELLGVETQGLSFLWLVATKIGRTQKGNIQETSSRCRKVMERIEKTCEKHHPTIIGNTFHHLFGGAYYTSKIGVCFCCLIGVFNVFPMPPGSAGKPGVVDDGNRALWRSFAWAMPHLDLKSWGNTF